LSQLKDLVICDRLLCPQCHPPDRLWNCIVMFLVSLSKNYQTKIFHQQTIKHKFVLCSWSFHQCTVHLLSWYITESRPAVSC
jgi:hypothetical protein